MSQDHDNASHSPTNPSRRRFIKGTGAAIGAGLLSGTAFSRLAFAAPRKLRIGYVTPRTGPLAPFAETDIFVIKHIRNLFKNGMRINGSKHPVEILVKDSQSNPDRAANVAASLILDDHVDLMLVASTPETTNPVSDQCEVNGVPCVSSVVPWQDWFYNRGGNPKQGFQFTYCFFWGVEDVVALYTHMWQSLKTNKVVGALWPNDVDGNYWGGDKFGFPPVLKKENYQLVDPGRYTDLSKDFGSQISAFKNKDVEILTGVPIPPDFATFWSQAAQKNFQPRIATIGKALLFPSSVDHMGAHGNNLSCEEWWSPFHPFRSSLTGETAAQLAKRWTKGTGKQWTQPLGFAHALFEVAVHALQHSQNIDDPGAISSAIAKTKLDTIVGPLDWTNGPVPNVTKTPLVGGQWRRQDGGSFELKIVDNSLAPEIETQSHLEPLA
jgi:branched-chain amino acid transport system substrate-binding protein